jgi:hypothetical protein
MVPGRDGLPHSLEAVRLSLLKRSARLPAAMRKAQPARLLGVADPGNERFPTGN